MEEGCGIEVREEGGRVRVVMPVARGEASAQPDSSAGRAMSWIFGVTFALMVVGGWCAAVYEAMRLRRFFPINNVADLIVVVGFVIAGTIPGVGLVMMTWILATAFFVQREEFLVEGENVTEILRRGPWVRRWRVKRREITEVVVGAPPRISAAELMKPLAERRAAVWMVCGKKRRKIQCVYPHAVARELARILRERVGEQVAVNWGETEKGQVVREEDWVNPATLNADVEETGNEAQFDVRREEGRVVIGTTHGLRAGKLIWNVNFRTGVWLVLVPIAAYLGLPLLPLPVPPGDLQKMLLIVLVIHGVPGVLMMAAAVWDQCAWVEYDVSAKELTRTLRGGFFRRRRAWKREEIAAVRVTQRLRGQESDAACAGGIDAGWNAGGDRGGRGWGVCEGWGRCCDGSWGWGADAEVRRADPTERRWHLEDEEGRPEKMPFEILEGDGELVVREVWPGWKRGETVAGAFGVAALIGAVLVLGIGLPRAVKPDDVEAVWLGAVWLAVIGLFMWGLILYVVVYRWVMVVTETEMTSVKRTLFGKSVRVWALMEMWRRFGRRRAGFPSESEDGCAAGAAGEGEGGGGGW